jgi:Ca-activated chloride channel family protein
MKATVRLDHELLAVEGEHTVHAMLELVAPTSDDTSQRPPLCLALVIDRSGSMAGAKLDHTKEAAAYLVRRLAPRDQFALITYDDEVQLRASMGPVDQTRLQREIADISPGGMTNLSGGWLKGAEEAARPPGDGNRKVLLLTDGLANHGVVDLDTLVGMATTLKATGVGTTTIGYGEGFNEDLLSAMADGGGGNAYFAESPEDAPGIFADEFTNLAAMVAQNLSVEIRPTDEVKLLGVLNEYPATEVAGGLQLGLGDVYSEENRRIVFELHIPELARLGVCQVAEVVIRYVAVGQALATHELRLPLVVNMVSAHEAAAAAPDEAIIEEIVILKAAQAQKEARSRADMGDFSGAQHLLRFSAGELRRVAPESTRAEELLSEAAFMEDHAARASAATWDSMHSKRVHYNARRMTRSRRRPTKPDES